MNGVIEKAVYVSDIKGIETAGPDYSRVYYGIEFCEIALPSFGEAGKAYKAASDRGMRFTLMTPYATDSGLDKLERLITGLAELGEMEVVVNDYGTLALLRQLKAPLKPILGRLLVKQKRGFGIFKGAMGYSDELISHFMSSNTDNPYIRGFLREQGVARVEFDNLIQGIETDLKGSEIRGSLYVPYGYITTTRLCSWSYDKNGWKSLKNACSRSCRLDVLTLDSDIMCQEIYLRGNTQFFKNDTVPSDEYLTNAGIDRLVYQPAIPV